jgi:hypothetical protein
MKTTDTHARRVAWPVLAVVALAAALTLLLADVGAAKWKKGSYFGNSSQYPMHSGFLLDVTKKRVSGEFDFYTGCGVPMCEPTAHGSAKIKKKGKKGKFTITLDAGRGHVSGTVKGKKAEGSALFKPQGLLVDWVAYYGNKCFNEVCRP